MQMTRLKFIFQLVIDLLFYNSRVAKLSLQSNSNIAFKEVNGGKIGFSVIVLPLYVIKRKDLIYSSCTDTLQFI